MSDNDIYPPVHDGLRLSLQFRWNQDGDSVLKKIAIASEVPWQKIKRFMDGDDGAINAIDRCCIENLM